MHGCREKVTKQFRTVRIVIELDCGNTYINSIILPMFEAGGGGGVFKKPPPRARLFKKKNFFKIVFFKIFILWGGFFSFVFVLDNKYK